MTTLRASQISLAVTGESKDLGKNGICPKVQGTVADTLH
jgi:hypothetical protein